jgi:hypothetical protein
MQLLQYRYMQGIPNFWENSTISECETYHNKQNQKLHCAMYPRGELGNVKPAAHSASH